MKKLTHEELLKAYIGWKLKYYPKGIDEDISPFLSDKMKPTSKMEGSWLKRVRQALFLSTQTVADQLNISKAAYSKYEENEALGTISISTLSKAAEAMDCELVYAIRPKKRKIFSELIWSKIIPHAEAHPRLAKCDQKRRESTLISIINKFANDTEFRKKQNWSQRRAE